MQVVVTIRLYALNCSLFSEHLGCGVDGTMYARCTARIAYLASFLYPALYTMSETNLWEIRGKYGQFIKLKFIELDVNNQIFSIVDSFVEVFDIGLNKERSSSMGRFAKATKPHVDLLSSWHMMDVEFRVGSDLTGRGFFGLYTIVDMISDNILNTSRSSKYIYLIFPEY
jgi:hypothetical protein